METWDELLASPKNSEAEFLKWLEKATKQQIWEYKQRTDLQLLVYRNMMIDFNVAAAHNERIVNELRKLRKTERKASITSYPQLLNIAQNMYRQLSAIEPENKYVKRYEVYFGSNEIEKGVQND